MAEYRYKLDFYYQQLLMYLVTMLVYVSVRGWMIDERFRDVLSDPILYIFAFFVILAFVVLVLNKIRGRKIILTEKAVIFHHRFNEQLVPLSEIEWMHVGKERGVRTAGKMQVVIMKVHGRHRSYKIRIGRYEREKELLAALEKLAANAPTRKKRRFRLQRS
jgi:hypothetical protein